VPGFGGRHGEGGKGRHDLFPDEEHQQVDREVRHEGYHADRDPELELPPPPVGFLLPLLEFGDEAFEDGEPFADLKEVRLSDFVLKTVESLNESGCFELQIADQIGGRFRGNANLLRLD
jgi:hypothetical protein